MIPLDRSRVFPSATLTSTNAALAIATDSDGADLANRESSSAAWISMREQLSAAQYDKCGWCESPLDDRAIEMDHIRPKKRTMYWWLAFELENLLAACRSCNNLKLDKWPLLPGGVRLTARNKRSTHGEAAAVIDPTWEDPTPHLTFLYDLGEWHYWWTDSRGEQTVDTLKLRRDGLRRKLNHHARAALDPWIADAQRAMRDDDRALYDQAVGHLSARCQSREPYAAFSRHVTKEGLSARYLPGA